MKRIKILCAVLLVIAIGLILALTWRSPAQRQQQGITRPAIASVPAEINAAVITTAVPTTATTQLPSHHKSPPPSTFLPNEQLLATATPLTLRELPTAQPDRVQRQRLVKTDFKYPLLRVVETVRRDAATGQEMIEHREVAVADHVLVRVRPATTAPEIAAWAARLGGAVRKKMYTADMFLVSFPEPTLDTLPDRMRDLLQIPGIELAEPDYIVSTTDTTPNDTNYGLLYGMHNTGQTIGGQVGIADADIDAPAAWDITTGDPSIVVGVIDTGVDYNHPDLATNAWVNPGEIAGNGIDDDANGFIDDIYGWDFINDDSNPMDDNSHGTHCAGTIGGVGNNNVGVVGVCWTVKIMGLKFLGASGSGAISDAIDCTNYATRMRVRLTSNSWGGGGFSASMLAAIETANRSNILFVAAAGNANNNNDASPSYPASYTNANIIAVAATDNRDQRASFSSYGLTSVDIGAPGVSTYSTTPGNGYGYKSGTSMATPHVAGACALAFARKPDATSAEIKQAILSGADPIAALSGLCVTGGRLNIFDTLQLLDVNQSVTPQADTLFTGPDAGPFTPATNTYIIANIGTNTFSWTATETAAWLDLSLTSGTLTPGQSNTIIVTWNATASTLAPGNYTGAIQFSNTVSAVPVLRTVTLQVLDSLSITPSTGFTAVGPQGGPFSPNSQAYVLSNRASTVRNWAGLSSAAWLTVPTSGSLPANATTNVSVALNATANTQPAGRYDASATFSNLTTGSTQSYLVSLRAGVDDFTELFSANDNDLDNQSWTFTPNGSGMYYAVCRNPIAAFPTDPTGGTSVSLSDDSFVSVTLTGGASVALYGVTYTNLFIGSNGYITFGSGDTTYDESTTAHFNLPRITALFDDLNPATGGTISRKQLADRIAVTYQNIPQYNVADANSFQFELFFDGRIRVSYLAIAAADGLVGLSSGSGVPVAFQESDFSGYALCPPPTDLALTLTGTPNPVGIGSNLNYSITVTNLGGADAISVTVTDSLPASVTFVSASPGCTFNAGQVICDLGTLTGGGQSNISILVTPDLRAVITNSALVTSATVEFITTNNAASYLTTVTGPPTTNAALANLALSTGTLSPTFDSNTLSYAASVLYATTSLTVTPTAADPYSTIRVNGNPITSGNPSGPIALSLGDNVITTEVVAESLTETNTYTITVTRLPASTNADLANLVSSAGAISPVFASSTFGYTQSVTFAVASLTVTPTAADPTATIAVGGNPVASGNPSPSISLSVGTNTINTVVVSESLTVTNTYVLTTIRGASIARWWDGGSVDIVSLGNGASNGGTGVWNTTVQNWDQGNGEAHGPWDNAGGNVAVFGGASGVVTNQGVTVGGLIFTAAYTVTGNTLTFAGGGSISNSAAVTIASTVAGTTGLIKSGAGALTLSASNTFSGDVTLQGGSLIDVDDYTLGTGGNLIFSGNSTLGALYAGYPVLAKTVTINPNVTATFAMGTQYTTFTFTGPLTGSGTLTETTGNNGAVTFANAGNTFTGPIVVGSSGNQVSYLTLNSLADSASPIRLYGNAYFQVGAGPAAPMVFTNRQIELLGTTTGSFVKNNNGTLANTITIHTDLKVTGVGNKALTLGGTQTGTNVFAGTIPNGTNSVISVTKADAGTWYLAGTNTYSGGTTLSAGRLIANGSNALGNATVTVSAGTLTIQAADAMADTAALRLPSAATKNLIMNANDTVGALFLAGIQQPNGVYTSSGSASNWMSGAGILTVGSAVGYWDLDGTTAGAGGATPAGTWNATNTHWNSDAAGTNITAAWSAGATAAFAAGSNATGTYAIAVDGTNDIVGLIFEEGNVTLAPGTDGGLRLTADLNVLVATGRTAIISTPLTQDANRSLSKIGTGTLILSASNRYSGGTVVAAGTLVLNGGQITNTALLSVGSAGIGNTALVISNSANLWSAGLLFGNGTSSNTVTISSNSTWNMLGGGITNGLGSATNNRLVVNGGVVSNVSLVTVGGTSGNSVTVSNGGRFVATTLSYTTGGTYNFGGPGARSSITIGTGQFTCQQTGGRLTVTNATLTANFSGGQYWGIGQNNITLSVLRDGMLVFSNPSGSLNPANSFGANTNVTLVVNGGVVTNHGGILFGGGGQASANYNNGIQLSDGAQWYGTNGNIQIAGGGIGNSNMFFNIGSIGESVTYSNTGTILIGGTGSKKNTMTVTNANVWSGALTLGSGGTNNAVSVFADATWNLLTNNITVGTGAVTGNVLTVSTGGVVTNVGTLSIGPGAARSNAVVLSGGSLLANSLTATNVGNQVTFNAGTLSIASSTVYSNGTDFVVGDGAQAATLVLNGGTHRFQTALTVANGGTLGGTGTVSGTTFVLDGGILAPGNSVGTLRFTGGTLILSNSTALNFELGTNSDSVVCTNLVLNGVLTVTDAGGFGPGTNTLFTYTGTLTDNGLTVNNPLPGGYTGTIDTGTAGQVKLIVTTGVTPPVASFTGTPVSGLAPLQVVFTDTSTETPTSWEWDFDNNGSTDSTGQNPTNTYAAGTYSVKLIACNTAGCSTNIQNSYITAFSALESWESTYGVPADGTDSDGDGESNLDEFRAGFNPTNSAASLRILDMTRSGNDIIITFRGANGDTSYVGGPSTMTNVLDYATAPASGSFTNGFVPAGLTNILSGGTGTGIITNFVDSGGATNSPSHFYRVRVLTP